MVSRLSDSGINNSCTNICNTLSNIPYLPFTKPAALRCTISNLSELYFGVGARQWHCILGKTLLERSTRFPLVFWVAPQKRQVGVSCSCNDVNVFCPLQVITKSYCYNMYCSILWYDCSKTALKKLRTAYNNSLRKLVDLPKYNSASEMFVCLNLFLKVWCHALYL